MADETEKPIPEAVKMSVFTPLIYVGVVLTAFMIFSIWYRKKRVDKFKEVKPIFKENSNALIYQELKSQYTDPNLAKDKKPHEKVMKAALLRRAAEAIRRSMKLKENEPIFHKLYQNGLIGDDMFKQLEFQIKFQEIELKDIVVECESYKKGWSQTFFPLAQEICFNEALRRRMNAMDERFENLSQLWDYQASPSK
ncbi:sec66 [Candida oxycetoniae]|uniref:Sec66 n=1 Tax=Candida oxycetoniae TaxID=497107 RepID=A0AAI9T227_9ASCO|nr:sec66 [Candida oxycetoniae]KAI3406660.2 sec66 [Candida oxycetoniae]